MEQQHFSIIKKKKNIKNVSLDNGQTLYDFEKTIHAALFEKCNKNIAICDDMEHQLLNYISLEFYEKYKKIRNLEKGAFRIINPNVSDCKRLMKLKIKIVLLGDSVDLPEWRELKEIIDQSVLKLVTCINYDLEKVNKISVSRIMNTVTEEVARLQTNEDSYLSLIRGFAKNLWGQRLIPVNQRVKTSV